MGAIQIYHFCISFIQIQIIDHPHSMIEMYFSLFDTSISVLCLQPRRPHVGIRLAITTLLKCTALYNISHSAIISMHEYGYICMKHAAE